jgi:hypothetical protein
MLPASGSLLAVMPAVTTAGMAAQGMAAEVEAVEEALEAAEIIEEMAEAAMAGRVGLRMQVPVVEVAPAAPPTADLLGGVVPTPAGAEAGKGRQAQEALSPAGANGWE